MGCIFVPLQMLALASVPISQLPNATALFSVVRNVGGSAGVAISTTLLSRRAQTHQSALVAHVNIWDPETAERLRQWTDHFVARGADTVTAGRQAMAMLYRETQVQAQVLAFMDDFRVLAAMYAALVVLVILMRRVRTTPAQATKSPTEPALVAPARVSRAERAPTCHAAAQTGRGEGSRCEAAGAGRREAYLPYVERRARPRQRSRWALIRVPR